jgi:hypothetical protein
MGTHVIPCYTEIEKEMERRARANPQLRLLIDAFGELGRKLNQSSDLTYLEKALKEYPQHATPEQVTRCMSWHDGHGKQPKRWGATFYNWCSNGKSRPESAGTDTAPDDESQVENTRRYLEAQNRHGPKRTNPATKP